MTRQLQGTDDPLELSGARAASARDVCDALHAYYRLVPGEQVSAFFYDVASDLWTITIDQPVEQVLGMVE